MTETTSYDTAPRSDSSALVVTQVPQELELRAIEGIARWLGPLRSWALRLVSMIEQPVRTMSGHLTPIEGYFRRDRYRHPRIDPQTYALRVTGVAKPRSFTLDELLALPSEDRVLVMECAGNGNHTMGSAGLVGQARWSGPSLRTVLEACGGEGVASHFAFHGLDPIPVVRRGYHYGLAFEELTAAGALLALRMNGEPLPRQRGFPVRLVVPGIYSMSHVKWLGHIQGLTTPHNGIHNRWVFVNEERKDGAWVRVQARWIGLKSMITRCQRHGDGWLLSGWAWGGGQTIGRVCITTDGGASWQEAELEPPSEFFGGDSRLRPADLRHAWTVFHHHWIPRGPGRFRLGSRAWATDGREQPLQDDPNVRGHFNQTRVKWRDVDVPADS